MSQFENIAISWYFMYLGLLTGSWISRIPDIKVNNSFSNTQMGLALLCGALGAMCMLPVSALANRLLGSAKCTLIGSLLSCISMPFLGINEAGMKIIVPSIFLIGSGMAMTDISMTTQAITFEKVENLKKMGFFGACGGIGNLSGVLLGGVFVYLDISTLKHFVLVSVSFATISVISYCWLYSKQIEKDIQNIHFSSFSQAPNDTQDMKEERKMDAIKYIRYLSVVGFLCQLGAGTIGDWSGIYFEDNLGCTPFVRAIGFGIYVFFSTAGNFTVDYLCRYFNRNVLLKVGLLIGAIGLGIVVLSPSLDPVYAKYIAIFGMGVAGTGLSLPPPIIGSSTGDIKGIKPSDAITVVTSLNYLGFLIGPPFFGALSDLVHNLRWSLAVAVGLLTLAIFIPGNLPNRIDNNETGKYENTVQNEFIYDRLMSRDEINDEGEETANLNGPEDKSGALLLPP